MADIKKVIEIIDDVLNNHALVTVEFLDEKMREVKALLQKDLGLQPAPKPADGGADKKGNEQCQ